MLSQLIATLRHSCLVFFVLLVATTFLVAPTTAASGLPRHNIMASRSPACALQSPWLPEYHLDSTCDRAFHNSPEQRARRLAEYQKVLFEQQQQQQQQEATRTTRTISTTSSSSNNNNNNNNNDSTDHPQLPMEATIACPNTKVELQDLRRTHEKDGISRFFSWGLPTKWIVENTARAPVVVALVFTNNSSLPATENHHQYPQQYLVSAAHPNLQLPPQQDPDAVLEPGEWKAFDVLEGQVYHVYQVLQGNIKGTERNSLSLGRLLLQHRVGLISISNYDKKRDNNNDQAHRQPEWAQLCRNAANDKRPNTKTSSSLSTPTSTTNDNVTRSFPLIMLNNHHERCNLLYRGFRNDLGCDVDVYYVRSKGPGEPCVEVKKFHLGSHEDESLRLHSTRSSDQDDHSSRIHYQATLVDSTFVVRLTQHPEVVVNTITIQPTRITDCNDSPAVTDSSSNMSLDRSNLLQQQQKQEQGQ